MKDDLEKYIEKCKRADRAFAENFEAGYQEFKIGLILRQPREQASVTLEKPATDTNSEITHFAFGK